MKKIKLFCIQACVDDKLKLETLEQGIVVEIIFAVGQIVIAFIIKRIGNFPIICKIQIFEKKTWVDLKEQHINF